MSNWNIYKTFENIFLRNGLYCSSWQNMDEDLAFVYIYKNVYKNHKDNIVTQSNHYRIYIVGNIESIWVWNRKWKKKLKRAMFKKLQVLTSITECSIACMRYLRSFPHCMHILQKCIRMRLYFCSWEKLTFLHNDLFSFM